jgi:hypothetical protein
MVSLCDTHCGNFNKFAKFVKMARVQRVKTHSLLNPQAYSHHIDPQAHNKPFIRPFPLGVLGE